jgi:hypothetical protein
MKICKKHGELTEDQVFRHPSENYGRCKICRSLERKKWYEKNKQRIIAEVYKNSGKYRQRNKDYITNLLSKSCCVDCGNTNLIVLEFDHLKDKKYGIAYLISRGASLGKLQKEIDKCDIVCANCHRIRTDTRARTYRFHAEQNRLV